MMNAERFTVVNKDGNPVKSGDVVTDFRDEWWIFLGVAREPIPGKSAKVRVREYEGTWEMEYYAKVFDLVVTDKETGHVDNM